MAILCHCNAVSERTIRRSIRHGARTVEAIGAACGAGTCCGTCRVWLDEMLERDAAHVGTVVAIAPSAG